MKQYCLAAAVAACVSFGVAVPPLAAQTTNAGKADRSPATGPALSVATSAKTCLGDLRAFDGQMEKDGHWLSGFGYAVGGVGYFGYGYPGDYPSATGADFRNARPGYEVRMLMASANILARHGQQQACEDVLTTTRDIYKIYAANLHSGKVAKVDLPTWRQKQIANAQPVTSDNQSFRSDELLGTDVRNQQNEALGSVDDLVLNPKTGKIAYLVISRGGVFGVDEKYVPIPWEDFKATPNANLLVLDSSKAAMDAAPQVTTDQFAPAEHFKQESDKVDLYWKSHISNRTNN